MIEVEGEKLIVRFLGLVIHDVDENLQDGTAGQQEIAAVVWHRERHIDGQSKGCREGRPRP